MFMFSFARRALLWLAAATVKAQDELAALGLTAASPATNHPISGQRKTPDMNLLNHNNS
jgi:hypothetical protein